MKPVLYVDIATEKSCSSFGRTYFLMFNIRRNIVAFGETNITPRCENEGFNAISNPTFYCVYLGHVASVISGSTIFDLATSIFNQFHNKIEFAQVTHSIHRPVTSLGHQEGRKVFREGPKFFKLCPIFLNMSNTFFQGGEAPSRLRA